MTAPNALVNVVMEEPDLTAQLSTPLLEAARRDGVAQLVEVQTGEWLPPETTPAERGGLGLLVLDGVLVRGVSMGGREGLELFGAGDLVRPVAPEAAFHTTMPARLRWSTLTQTRLAVLDAGFTQRMCGYPGVIDELAGRIERRSYTHAVRFAIIQQPRLSVRLQLMLWHLADRFGRMHSGGVVLPLPLSHGLLAQLVGAQRPSVSRALKELERQNILARRLDGSWWLGHRPLAGENN